MTASPVIESTSVSQVERFDRTQKAGCELRWWFTRQFKEPDSASKDDGIAGHDLFARYLTHGEIPMGRVRMGKMVRAAIAKGALPQPGPDLIVERRFSDQPARDPAGNWIPLDPERTPIHIGGVPWDGFIDLMFSREDEIVDVLDHKFTSDMSKALAPDDLIKTVQLPVYCLKAVQIWPDAKQFRISHHYVSRSGEESDLRPKIVTWSQIEDRLASVALTVESMKEVARATRQEDVRFNRKACEAFNGCPHQSRCNAFKRNLVELTPEELALFGPPAPAPLSPAVQAAAALADAIQSRPSAVQHPGLPSDASVQPVAQVIPLDAPSNSAIPDCTVCGVALDLENSSKLTSGAWKHIGCSGIAPTIASHPVATPPPAPGTINPSPKRGPGRPPKGTATPAPAPAVQDATPVLSHPKATLISYRVNGKETACVSPLPNGGISIEIAQDWAPSGAPLTALFQLVLATLTK